MRILGVLATGLLLGGCATVTRGVTDQVTINSEPSGAMATTSEGHTCTATPCTFAVDRKAEFIVSFKKDGYKDQQVPVTTRVAGAGAAGFAGNILLGGVVGMGVDAATGATLEHVPNPVFVTLEPVSPPSLVRMPAKTARKATKPMPVALEPAGPQT